jgi:hypothetical protein
VTAEHDVDARLSAGRSAVADFAEYVRACEQLGYSYPELAGLSERYAAEEGLDLVALDGDVTALAALASRADEAVRQQADLTTTLTGSWVGSGAAAALDFLRRHQQGAATVAAALHEAAGTLGGLRDELWRAIDVKVDTTQAIDARAVGRRAAWLAASRTVATGTGDRSVASELIEQQVKPFVDNDIRSEWLTAMRTGTASVVAAYDAAVARLRAAPQAIFEVPGQLGPEWVAPVDQPGPSPSPGAAAPSSPGGAGAGVVPAALAMPAAAPAAMPAPQTSFAPEPPPAPPVPAAAGAPIGGLGGGAPGLGGMGLSGIGQQLSDLIGGLVGASADAAPELPDVDPPDLREADGFDGSDDEDPADDEASEEDQEGEDEEGEDPEGEDPEIGDDEPTDAAVESAADEPEGPTEPPPPQQAPTPVPAEPGPPVPPADVVPPPEQKTPCELAADELPQVGG